LLKNLLRKLQNLDDQSTGEGTATRKCTQYFHGIPGRNKEAKHIKKSRQEKNSTVKFKLEVGTGETTRGRETTF